MSRFRTKIDWDGLEELQDMLDKKGSRIFFHEMINAMEDSTEFMEKQIKLLTPVGASGGGGGGLRSSIRAQPVRRIQRAVTGRITADVEHAIPVEEGRKAAPIPVRPLMDWVRARLDVTDQKEQLSIAIAISRHASKHRRPGRFMFKRAMQAYSPVVFNKFDRALDRTLQRMAVE